jgi:hypothetical protein
MRALPEDVAAAYLTVMRTMRAEAAKLDDTSEHSRWLHAEAQKIDQFLADPPLTQAVERSPEEIAENRRRVRAWRRLPQEVRERAVLERIELEGPMTLTQLRGWFQKEDPFDCQVLDRNIRRELDRLTDVGALHRECRVPGKPNQGYIWMKAAGPLEGPIADLEKQFLEVTPEKEDR